MRGLFWGVASGHADKVITGDVRQVQAQPPQRVRDQQWELLAGDFEGQWPVTDLFRLQR